MIEAALAVAGIPQDCFRVVVIDNYPMDCQRPKLVGGGPTL